jgi:hypothetical protein
MCGKAFATLFYSIYLFELFLDWRCCRLRTEMRIYYRLIRKWNPWIGPAILQRMLAGCCFIFIELLLTCDSRTCRRCLDITVFHQLYCSFLILFSCVQTMFLLLHFLLNSWQFFC